ncbi:Mycosubtilin synthase subunit B [Corynebacterium pseudotuberculosis]|uniref:Pls/PosA family non-ribosomal peptide synthetase n=1 Tax=Corynebacterium pseudotuberculosis TaxID=1719 RepID=UPI000C1CC8B2|nr:Pls/PosA family non-ribosomal peptide synthetase [Corynebacterium pseudotuberculosis]ATV80043.1 Mycosubtilin synthase subunit B [Corynebacterium pseudotuberculosis]
MISSAYLRSHQAPAPRTLYDIFLQTATTFPEVAAIDDGTVITYHELSERVHAGAQQLHAAGVGPGSRIGVRMASGHSELYIAILSILAAGAAYVPVDADDPDERAELVFGEADIQGFYNDHGFHSLQEADPITAAVPALEDTAWIIFTSGSTGKPKGVAVSHRSAAAFVDAESQLFLQDAPLGPDDRVLAGLSVAFDASCEEMWLAWAHGACLVPAPRSLVRSGMDLGPWLIRRDITVVSTVPTLAGLWPTEALESVRLLILGGEACSTELVEKLSASEREVWNTYGPTEATVVACAALLSPHRPVSIGFPLAGWDLAVVDAQGAPVKNGEIGELVIGGVGLARYLDPQKDAEKYTAELGWSRAYRSGDHVKLTEEGLIFVGRVDDQVKIGGRRIELGEVDAHLAALPNVRQSTVVVQKTGAGDSVLVGYLSLTDETLEFDHHHARNVLSNAMPAALVPRLCVLAELPTTTSGKVDKRALPWPIHSDVTAVGLTDTERWLAKIWVDVLGMDVSDANADFFSLGGSSLAAATLIGRIRERVPTIAVRDLYDHPRLGALAQRVESIHAAPALQETPVQLVSARARAVQGLVQLAAVTLISLQWIACLLLINNIAASAGISWARHAPWPLVFRIPRLVIPVGRLLVGGYAARLLTHGIMPGSYPRAGRTHLRVWAAERIANASGSRSIAGATWVNYYARILGARVGNGVNLHAIPPVTGLLTLEDNCSIEPEVDLSGYWVDAQHIHIGAIHVGKNARIGARSVLMPGAVIGNNAHVEAGSTVTGDKPVKANARWSGSPAHKVGRSKHRFPDTPPPRRPHWVLIYGASSLFLAALPLCAVGLGGAAMIAAVQSSGADPFLGLLSAAPAGTLIAFALYGLCIWILVRLLSLRLTPGVAPVRSATGWRVWFIQRLMDDARTYLFPLYAAQLTSLWFRSLGATVGKDVEISTSVMVPAFVDIRDGSFLADDTLIGGYELGGGWMLAGATKIGKRSFVGNSGIAGPLRKLAKNSLVAVLSSTPKKSKAGSNWWGSPPERMRRVTITTDASENSTYKPLLQLRILRGFIETLRLLAPITSGVLATIVLATLQIVLISLGIGAAILLGGVVLIVAGITALLITAGMKWLCVGRHRSGDHPLWSWFVWLNELQDTFVEVVAAPWFFNHTLGTGSLNIGLRVLGAKIGKGAWIETYWLPETDLCRIGAGATIGPGVVAQTHLFQDRVMSLDSLILQPGATLAAHSVALPASKLANGATIGPGSLVMRGDQVPAHTRWQGNPIEPWNPS